MRESFLISWIKFFLFLSKKHFLLNEFSFDLSIEFWQGRRFHFYLFGFFLFTSLIPFIWVLMLNFWSYKGFHQQQIGKSMICFKIFHSAVGFFILVWSFVYYLLLLIFFSFQYLFNWLECSEYVVLAGFHGKMLVIEGVILMVVWLITTNN